MQQRKKSLSRVAFYRKGKPVTWEDVLVGSLIASAGLVLGAIFLLTLISLEPRGASEDVLVVELRPVVVEVVNLESLTANALASEQLAMGLIELGGRRVPSAQYLGSPSFGEDEPWYKCLVYLPVRSEEKIGWECGRGGDSYEFESGEAYATIEVAKKLASYAQRHRN